MTINSAAGLTRRQALFGAGVLAGGSLLGTAVTGCSSSDKAKGAAGDDTLAKMRAAKYARLGSYNQLAHGWFEGGKWHGMDVDIVGYMLPKMDIPKWDYTVADWSGLIPGLVAKRWDFMSIGMSIFPERQKQVLFSQPVYRSGSALIVPKGSPVKGHSSFSGRKIGAVLGAGELDDIKSVPGAKAVPYKTAGDMFSDLKAGRIEAAEMDEGEASYAFSVNPVPELEVLHEWDGKVWYKAGIVMRLGDKNLETEVNKYVTELKENGQMLAILKKYGFGETNMLDLTGEPSK